MQNIQKHQKFYNKHKNLTKHWSDATVACRCIGRLQSVRLPCRDVSNTNYECLIMLLSPTCGEIHPCTDTQTKRNILSLKLVLRRGTVLMMEWCNLRQRFRLKSLIKLPSISTFLGKTVSEKLFLICFQGFNS